MKIAPADCRDIHTAARLNEQGVKINDDSLVIRPNQVILTRGNITVNLPMSLFKTFAQWYLEPQELLDKPTTRKTELDELLDFVNLEICERRDYSASKSFEVVRDKILEMKLKPNTYTGGY